MRKFSLIPCTLLSLALSFGAVACDGDDGNGDGTAEGTDTNNPGDGDGDDPTTTGDGDGDDPTTTGDGDGCFEAPEECLRLVECLGEILPAAQADADAQLGADGSCWCGTEEEAVACYNTCTSQLDAAITQNPTVGVCHGQYCPLEELDPTQPYGPPESGCLAGETPLTVGAGSYCAPECSGIAESCPGHTQTVSNGTCLNNGRCALLCRVDPFYIPNSTQCQCGAECDPIGQNDADGNALGFCVYK